MAKKILRNQVTVPGNVDAIHSMILDNQRTSDKKIAETLRISQERDFRHAKALSQIGSQIPQCWLVRCVIECLLHKPFWTDFGGIQLTGHQVP
jgi:hypothetical protein